MSSSATTPIPSASLAPPPSTLTRKTSAKSAKGKPGNIVVLRLSPEALRKFPTDFATGGDASAASRSAASSPPSEDTKTAVSSIQETKDNTLGEAKPEDDNSHAATPNPPDTNGDTAGPHPASNGIKRKASTGDQGGASGKPNGADAEGKPKAKAGPKRRKLDPDGKGMWTAPPHLSHRLGPKANQGDINARLRALDRTGKPCRKWQRKGVQLASFTGVKWSGLGSWKTTKLPDVNIDGDGQSETTGSSEPKREPRSSNVASEKSNAGAPDGATNAAADSAGVAASAPANGTPLPSSPAPVASASA